MAMCYNNLPTNIHDGLLPPEHDLPVFLVKGTYKYYHYGCDGLNDRGWGCGYRTLQTICSWVSEALDDAKSPPVPSIPEIQNVLIQIGDKPLQFKGSRDWIGSVEVCLVVDQLYNIPSKLIHVMKGSELLNHIPTLVEHFNNFGSPVMMGGDMDCSAKGILGVQKGSTGTSVLVLDPHFSGQAKSKLELQQQEWIKWQHLDDFLESSFYNLCLPQLKNTKSYCKAK